MAKFVVIAWHLEEVRMLPSFRRVPGVVLWCNAAGTASGRTGKPTTSSTVSLKLTEHHSNNILRALIRALRLLQETWEISAPFVWTS